jgi:hypothetical protein
MDTKTPRAKCLYRLRFGAPELRAGQARSARPEMLTQKNQPAAALPQHALRTVREEIRDCWEISAESPEPRQRTDVYGATPDPFKN